VAFEGWYIEFQPMFNRPPTSDPGMGAFFCGRGNQSPQGWSTINRPSGFPLDAY